MNNIATIMVPVIAAVFIFNFTAINSLIQDFYKKYNSILLLKEILNVYTIFITIIIPAIFILIFILGENFTNNIQNFIAVLSVIYCIGSSIWLIFRTKYLQNQNRIIKKLLSEISDSEIRNYKNNNILDTENRLDILLKIVISFIRNNDINSAEDIFNLLFNWVNQKIDLIHTDSDNYWALINNRFYRFFISITDEVLNSKNSFIQDTYLIILYNQVLNNSKLENISDYEYLLESISFFIKEGLKNKELTTDKILKKAFSILLVRIPLYLCDINVSEKYSLKDKELYLLDESDDFNIFKDRLYNKIDSILRLAAETNNIDFIISADLFRECFKNPEVLNTEPKVINKPYPVYKELEIKWNVNYYQLLQEITHTYSVIFYKQKNQGLNFNIKLWQNILDDYKSFMYHLEEFDLSNKVHLAISNTFFSSYEDMLNQILYNKIVISEMDFNDYLCEPVHYFLNKQKESFIKYFIYFVSQYLGYYLKNNIDRKEFYKLWSRIKAFQESNNTKELTDFINDEEKKYITHLSDFESWKKKCSEEFKILKSQIKEFWN